MTREAFERFYVSTGLNQSGLDWNDEFKVYRSDITHYMFLSWRHQQKTIDEQSKELKQAYEDIETFAKQAEDEARFKAQFAREVDEQQKRIDTAISHLNGFRCSETSMFVELALEALRGGQ